MGGGGGTVRCHVWKVCEASFSGGWPCWLARRRGCGCGDVFVGAGDPTAAAVELRDGLIAEQEALLNVYRCLFDIDTELVPSGCADTAQTPEPGQDSVVSLSMNGPIGGHFYCVANSEDIIGCSIDGVQVDTPGEPLTDLFAHAVRNSGHEGHVSVVLCGKRADQSLACWGWGRTFGEDGYSVRDDDGNPVLTSWEHDAPGGPSPVMLVALELEEPSGDGESYRSVYCALREDQTLDCWTWGTDLDEPAGPFTDIKPAGPFTGLSDQAYGIGCGSRVDQSIDCWTWDFRYDYEAEETVYSLVELDGPDASFGNVSSAGSVSCGWQADQPIHCWTWSGRYDYEARATVWSLVELDVPDESFDNVSYGDDMFCGLRAGQPIDCWTWESRYDSEAEVRVWSLVELDVPDESFGNVSSAGSVFCGWRAGQLIDCWTWESRYDSEAEVWVWSLVELDVPDESFDNVSSAGSVFCGWQDDLPADHTCWLWIRKWDDDYQNRLWELEVIDP